MSRRRVRALVLWLSGLDFALLVVLIGLKSGGAIDTPMVWVVAPLWIPGVLGLVLGYAVSRSTRESDGTPGGAR